MVVVVDGVVVDTVSDGVDVSEVNDDESCTLLSVTKCVVGFVVVAGCVVVVVGDTAGTGNEAVAVAVVVVVVVAFLWVVFIPSPPASTSRKSSARCFFTEFSMFSPPTPILEPLAVAGLESVSSLRWPFVVSLVVSRGSNDDADGTEEEDFKLASEVVDASIVVVVVGDVLVVVVVGGVVAAVLSCSRVSAERVVVVS